MRYEVVELTHQGLVREMNQDSILTLPEYGVFMVADGMGGEQAGEEASAQTVASTREVMLDFFRVPPGKPGQVEHSIREALLKANTDVFQISVREPAKRGLGSTGTLLCLHRGVYFIAHVGDSRIYLVRGGQMHQLTRDHTLVWLLYEQGSLQREQLETHPERHLLTQCVGSQKPIAVDTFEGAIQPGDVFLICSDGLTGYAGEEAMEKALLAQNLSLKEKADQLVTASLRAGGGDNVSVVLVKILELADHDDWEPEETAPPQKFSIEMTDEIIDAEMRPAPQPESRMPSPPLLALLALLLLAGGVSLTLLMGRSPAKVYLDGLPRKDVVVSARGAQQRETKPPVQQDKEGVFFMLPGPGLYNISVKLPDMIPVRQQINVLNDRKQIRLGIKPEQWIPEAELILRLARESMPDKIRILRDEPGEPAREEYLFEKDFLSANTLLNVSLEPGKCFLVIAECAGRREFVARGELQPGDERTMNIYFPEDAEQAR